MTMIKNLQNNALHTPKGVYMGFQSKLIAWDICT